MLLYEPIVTIQNVVATGALTHRIDLDAVVKAFPNVEYRPKQFPGIVFRIKKPKTATLIFTSGKMVCTGAKSEGESGKALRKVVRTLKKGGIIITGKLEVEVVNMVATANLGGSVDLIAFYESERSMGGRILYEPEQFPGLIYRMNEPRVVILLFTTGKLVCTGARKEEDAHLAVIKLYQRLKDKELLYYD